jgi:deoxyribodipyrimidine photo-lyase
MDGMRRLSEDPRVLVRRGGRPSGACVVYWMQKAQRGWDNAALDTAVSAANLLSLPCVVFLAPVPFYPHANLRHYRFLNDGIPDIADALEKRNVGFVLRRYPQHRLTDFCAEVEAALVVGDENPMREAERWRQIAAEKLTVPLWTVDADVIVPSRLMEKEQYAARTIRPRLQKLLDQFLLPSRNPKAHVAWKPRTRPPSLPPETDITEGWKLDRSVQPLRQFVGGSREGLRQLNDFVRNKLRDYPTLRNHPEVDGTSRLSAFLHFGHLGPVTVALAVQRAGAPQEAKDRFLDQLITWRELSVNLVHYNTNYDNFECGEPWAHKTLAQHAGDPRPIRYTEQQLENAETQDPLWNAAQMQMMNQGWMHNCMRMYWAKKILEWSGSPAEAYCIAVWLNDKYLNDGRDPNGYAGIAWSIVGKFDRPWFDRPIFGKIRYMSLESTRKKFDSKLYIRQQMPPKHL